jgi:hypothetical protein
MASADDIGEETLSQRLPPAQVVLDFKKAWEKADTLETAPDLKDHLPPRDDPQRLRIVMQLIKLDLEKRIQRRQAVTADRYLTQFPELNTREYLATLLFWEYQFRHLYGDKPAVASYRGRYPEHFDQLDQLIDRWYKAFYGTETASTPAGSAPVLPTPSARPVTPGGEVQPAGSYKLVERIGRGAFAEVWRATAPGDVAVAIKMIFRSADHEDTLREVEALQLIKNVRHPHLVAIQAFWTWQDRLFIAMELGEGTLRDRLKDAGPAAPPGMPVEELLRYFHDAADALDDLHARQLQHRDVKPDNLLRFGKHAKLADFGLVRLLRGLSQQTATYAGTPAYMAPEVRASKLSPHSDQYSLAMSYVELRLGVDRKHFSELRANLDADPMFKRPLGALPLEPFEREALRKALAEDPDRRFPSCRAFVRALEPPPPPPPPLWKRPATWMVGALTVAFLVVLGLWYFHAPVAPALVVDPETLTLTPNETKHVAVQLKGFGAKPLTLSFPDKPDGVSLEQDQDGDTIQVRVSAAAVPPFGRHTLSIVAAKAGGQEVIANLDLLVPFVPPGFEGDGTVELDIINNPLFPKLVRTFEEGSIVFRLIAARADDQDLRSFYIMETKMPVWLFRKFAADQKPALAMPEVSFAKDGDYNFYPAMNVTVADAYRCASEWLVPRRYGGHLPTAKEWDKAAGWEAWQRQEKRHPDAGPFKGLWTDKADALKIAVNRVNPARPVRIGAPEDADDVASPYDCQGMAGNGYEWTRDVNGALGDGSVPLAKPAADDYVKLRGQSYKERAPLLYRHFDKAAQTYRDASPELGFRVVIEPPPAATAANTRAE